MDDVKGFVKKYWPYIVGAIVGLYLILRFSAGSSGAGSSGDGGYSAMLAAQAQAAQQNAAIAAQQQAQKDQNAINNRALDVQNNKNYADAFNNFQTSQAAMAAALGDSVSKVIGSLNAPSITAMQAAATENAAALLAAGNVAANSFLSQGEMVKGNGTMISGIFQTVPNPTGLGQLGDKSDKWADRINAGANAYSAYASGGMSGMMQNGGGGGGGNPYAGSNNSGMFGNAANNGRNTTGNFGNYNYSYGN